MADLAAIREEEQRERGNYWNSRALAAEAEVGRLRHQIGVGPDEELPDAPDQGWSNYASDVEHLHKLAEDECDRLRAALRKIADHPNWYTEDGTTDLCDASCVEHLMALAKQAVEKGKGLNGG